MRKSVFLTTAISMALAVTLTAGCGVSKTAADLDYNSYVSATTAASNGSSVSYEHGYGGYSSSFGNGSYDEDLLIEETRDFADADMKSEEFEMSFDGTGSVKPAASDSSETDSQVTISQEKLIYTCHLTIETTEFDAAVSEIHDQIEAVGGFIESEWSGDYADGWYYSNYKKTNGTLYTSITVRVPADHYQDFLKSIEGNGRMVDREMNVENITQRYSETAIKIRSLEIQEERLLQMLDECDTVEDMITVEARLSDVQNELTIYKNSLSAMDTDVAYSTVTIRVNEVLEYLPEREPEHVLTFGDRLKNSLRNSGKDFLAFLEGLLFFIIEAGPILVVIGLIIFLLILIVRAIIRKIRRHSKKEASKTEAAARAVSENNSSASDQKNE